MHRRNRPAALAGAALAAAAALTACSSGSSASSSPGHYKIAFIPGDANDAYYGSVQCGIEAAAKATGSSVNTQAPQNFSPTDQIPILQAVIAKKPNVIIIAPTDSKALYAPLKRATAEGIKVVLVDTTLENPSLAVSQITSNNFTAGQVAAQTLSKLLGSKSGSVLTVNLSAGVTTTDARASGFAAGLKSDPKLAYLGQQYSNNSVQTAASIVSATLSAHQDLVGLFSTAAFNTEGAVSALDAAHKQNAVTIVGFDANPPGVKQIEQGKVAAQVVLKPYDEGLKAGQQAIDALEGKPITKKILTGALVATKANLSTPEVRKYLYSYTCPAS